MALATPQLSRLVHFYHMLLGIDPHPHIPHQYAEFQLPGLKLGIFQPRTDRLAEFATISSGAMSLCFEVEDLDAAIAHFTDLGYPPPAVAMSTSHGREIYVYDPDKNRLILHQADR